MMGRTCFFVLCLAAAARAASVPFGPMMLGSRLGDARLAAPPAEDTGLRFSAAPAADTHALTFAGWFRAVYPQSCTCYVTTMSFYTPDAVQTSNPDLAGGAFGFPNGVELGGALTLDPFPWQPYEAGTVPSNLWPRGVYTVAGWSSNAVTVTLGGASATLGPGAFNRNMLPGAGAAASVTGQGPAAVGISRTPAHEFFGAVDGVKDEGGMTLAAESILTNAWKFCVWRLKLDGAEHVCRVDMAPFERADFLSVTYTQRMPRVSRALSARGIYQFGFSGDLGDVDVRIDMFDPRLFHRWLDDAELMRVRANGIEELARRGIPLVAPRP